jgi:predicted nuclease of predicted toxin-antitoxin system
VPFRIQLDEHLDNAVAYQCRHRGVDAVTASESGLRATPDFIVLRHANSHERAVLTCHAHYLRLQYAGQPHCRIIYCTPTIRHAGQLVELVHLLRETEQQEEFVNRLEYL